MWGGVAYRPGLAGERWGKWRESGVIWLCRKWSLHFKCSPGRPETSWKGGQVPSPILEQQIGLCLSVLQPLIRQLETNKQTPKYVSLVLLKEVICSPVDGVKGGAMLDKGEGDFLN